MYKNELAKPDDDVVIDVNNIKKHFRVYFDRGNTLKEKVLFKNRRRYEERWVLKGISFQVKRGEAIGLIGHNGCGKSTTLKLLTRIYYPDEGNIKMRGRVSSLIELGAGFHPDMSGRENIYTNASIFGLTRTEISRRVNEIIAFSELEEFIDNPVRTYSSGMYMRLAFAVAINVDADILLIDEILAVGDAAFQAKCFNKLREIKAKGTTIVIVSHSLGQIEQICERSIWIDSGKIRMEGKPREVHPCYMEYMSNLNHLEAPELHEDDQDNEKTTDDVDDKKVDKEKKILEIDEVYLQDANGNEKNVYEANESMTIEINYSSQETIKDAVVGISILRVDDIQVFGTNTLIDHLDDCFLYSPSGKVKFHIDNLSLISGEYKLEVIINRSDGLPYDCKNDISSFKVISKNQEVGIAYLKHNWEY